MIHSLLATTFETPLPGRIDLVAVAPLLIVSLGFIAVMVFGALVQGAGAKTLALSLASGTLILGILAEVWEWAYNTIPPTVAGPPSTIAVYSYTFANDHTAQFVSILVLGSALLSLWASADYLTRRGLAVPEYCAVFLAATAGMMLLAAAVDLMVIFLAIELLSISLYILTGFRFWNTRSQEAGVKYLVLGGMASAFLLYGMALIYGVTGHTQLILISGMETQVKDLSTLGPLYVMGMVLILVGLAFKISAAPFHAWTPDVYQGAPVSVTTFMSVATKIAALTVMLRLFDVTFSTYGNAWYPFLAGISIMSMLWGNFGALTQTSVKRMLAYSGIAQGGYILIAIASAANTSNYAIAGSANGQSGAFVAVLFYMAAYTVTNLGAFAVLTVMSSAGRDLDSYDDIRGLAYKRPYVAGALCVFLLSLAGFPPTVGFFGKYLVFETAVSSGHIFLAIVGVVMSAVSVAYYLRVGLLLFAKPHAEESEQSWPKAGFLGASVVTITAVATIVLGILVNTILTPATEAVHHPIAANVSAPGQVTSVVGDIIVLS